MDKRVLEGKKGSYRLGGLIERSEWCNVYHCTTASRSGRHPGSLVAKEISLEYANVHERRARLDEFDDHARRYAELSHPALARVVDFFPFGFCHYIVYEFVPGLRLGQLLDRYEEPVGEDLALGMAWDVAEGLLFLHAQSDPLVFGDLSPSSVIITSEVGRARLTDYGLSRYLWPRGPEEPLMGTVGYAAPEQYGPEPTLLPASDIHALGAVVWQTLTLLRPADYQGRLPSLRSLDPQASTFVDEFVTRCTEPGLAARYSDVSQVLAALAGHDPTLRARSSPPRWPSKLLGPVKALFRKRAR